MVLVYDLGWGDRISGTQAGGELGNVQVPRVALDGSGVAAWIATGWTGASDGVAPSNSILQISDGLSTRDLWNGASLDEDILQLDDYKKKVSVADPANIFPPVAIAK
jgi:hypothetical protein